MRFLRLLLLSLIGLVPLTAPALSFGPSTIRECPRCAHRFQEIHVRSSNNLGAKYWSDGKVEGFGLRLKQLAVKCRKCQLVMWLPDCKAVGEESPLGLLSQKDRVEMPADPSETELLAFAATLGGYPEKETHVRLWAWWRRNDPIRRGQADVTGWTDERKQNLLSLEKLLDVTREEDHLAHAEIERELGNFDKSLKLLEGNWHEDNLPTVTALRKLAESKTPAVTKLSQIPDSLSSP